MSAFVFALVVQSGASDRSQNGRPRIENQERNLSIVRTDRHIMGSNDDDATAYVSHRLTRSMCSLITCREYDATLLRSTDSFFQSFMNLYK